MGSSLGVSRTNPTTSPIYLKEKNMIDKNQIIEKDPKTGRVRVYTLNLEKSLTQQQYAAECDINNIMRKYETTGEFTHLTGKTGVYADFSEIKDYREMLDTVRYADEAFKALPAKMRQRFGEDPGQLLEFLQDRKNYDEAVQLGLIDPKINDSTKNNSDSKPDSTTAPK